MPLLRTASMSEIICKILRTNKCNFLVAASQVNAAWDLEFQWVLITSSSHHHITQSPHHHITTSPHHFITTSPHHRITSSPHHHTTTSPHHHITSSPHHHITTSPHHLITSSPHHHTTTPPHHHTTTPPHHQAQSTLLTLPSSEPLFLADIFRASLFSLGHQQHSGVNSSQHLASVSEHMDLSNACS